MPHVCPWRHAYAFDNWLRRLVLNPERLFAPYVRRGMTVLDIGCGMGVNSIGLARLVGEEGRVIAADVQAEMLAVMRSRAEKAGVSQRIRAHQSQPDAIGVAEQVGFAVAFWMVHEVPDVPRFLSEVRSLLAADAHFFVAEPQMHVSGEAFEATLEAARGCGLAVHDRPRVLLSRAAVLRPE